MSLEFDIDGLIRDMAVNLDESFSKAKELYVDTQKMSLAHLKKLAEKDPTDTKKYVQWMAKMFVMGHRRNSRAFDIVKEFDALANKNKIEQKNIDSYQSLEALTDVVHQAHMKMGEEVRLKQEEEIRKALIKMNGSVENAYKYLNNKKFYIKQEDDSYILNPARDMATDPEYINRDTIQKLRNRMLKEEAGETWRNFTIDDEIFDHVKKEDVVFENKFVTVVEPKSKKMAQFYGRNMWYMPGSTSMRTSFWCVAYSGEHEGCLWDNYAYYDTAFVEGDETKITRKDHYHRFFIVLPKDISFVDKKTHAKVIIQAKEDGTREVWNTEDVQMSESEVNKLFRDWDMPWEGRVSK